MLNRRKWQRGTVSMLLLLGVFAIAGIWASLAPRTHADNVVQRSSQPARPDSTTPESEEPSPPAPSPAPEGKTPPADVPAEEPTADSAFRIDVDLSEQQVTVMQGDQEVKEMVTSSGAPGYDTPQGTFEIQNRGEWFYSSKYDEGAKWWVSFKDWGVYLFHSVPMDENRNIIAEEAEKLGTPASHGCLRLAVDDAKWIYDNIPQGTEVVVHA